MFKGSIGWSVACKAPSTFTCSGETIFKAGSNFEVKKMDPFVDSYLSEFLSMEL